VSIKKVTSNDPFRWTRNKLARGLHRRESQRQNKWNVFRYRLEKYRYTHLYLLRGYGMTVRSET